MAEWKLFHHLPTSVAQCVSEYIFFVSNKKTHSQKAKETKENRKTKEIKEEKEKENVVVVIVAVEKSVENLKRYDDIVWQFALCTFNLHDQPTKRERMLKNKLWKIFEYICLLYIQD